MDNAAMLAQLEALGQRVEQLVKTPHPDSINRAELEKTIDAYLVKMHPEKPKMVLPSDAATAEGAKEILMDLFGKFKQRPEAYEKSATWTSEYGKQFKNMHGFLGAVVRKDTRLARMDDGKASSDAMTEGTAASGGYLVPTEFNYTVLQLMYAATIARRICRLVPMSSWKRTLPTQTANLSVYWVSEFGAKTASKPTLYYITQQAKVMAAVIKSSDELLRDSAINLQTFLAELVAGAMAREEERLTFCGDVSGLSDPFNGVLYATSVTDSSMEGATLEYDDLINQQADLGEAYQPGAIWVTKRSGLKTIMKLKDAEGRPIWHSPREGNPGTILEKPYELSDQILTTFGAGGDLTGLLYGDFKNLWISDREGVAVKVSQDASDWVSAALDSAFMTDQTWMRFTKAESIDVMVPAAFTRMGIK